MDKRVVGVSAALASAASWAAGAILFDRIAEKMSSTAMTLAKSGVGVVLLAVALLAVEGRRSAKAEASLLTRLRGTDLRSLFLLAVSGVLGISVADTFFFEALHLLSAHTVVVLMMVGFILTPLLAMVCLKEKSTPARWLGIALVVEGIGVVVATSPEVEPGATRMVGLVFGLLSVVSMSVSFVIAKKALENLSSLQGTFVRMAVGFLGILALGLVRGGLGDWMEPFRDPEFVVFFLVAVFIVTFGGFWFTHAAIKYVDLTIANTLMATEPLFVLLLGVVVFRRGVTLLGFLGSLVAIQGVAVLLRALSTDRPDLKLPAAGEPTG
jgi:drug/metabolite transporter (DMT)-like permease